MPRCETLKERVLNTCINNRHLINTCFVGVVIVCLFGLVFGWGFVCVCVCACFVVVLYGYFISVPIN